MIHSQIHTYTDNSNLINFLKENIKDSAQLLIQLFLISTDEEYIQDIQYTLTSHLPHSHLIGTTTDGSIVQEGDADVTTISFTSFEKSHLKHTLVPFEPTQEDDCAKEIVKNILSSNSKLLLLFTDGLLCNSEKLTREIHNAYPNLLIAGGLAGDNAKLIKTFVCDNETIQTQAVVALSIDSDSLFIHNDYNLAWQPVGESMQVTKCSANIIHEIDNKPAAHIFKKHLNTQYLTHYDAPTHSPTISIEFPLLIQRDDMQIARVVFQILEDGSLFCSGELHEGDLLHFSFTHPKQIIQSGDALAARLKREPVQTLFIYSCMARRRFMGENILHDLAPLKNIAPLSGFYSYGEIFTTKKSVASVNHTMTIVGLSEEGDIYAYKEQKEPEIAHHSKASETLLALTSLIDSLPSQENFLSYTSCIMELKVNAQIIKLSKSETKLFHILHEHKNQALDSETIFAYVWSSADKEFSKDALRALVKKLRKKLPEESIENIYGGFYKLKISYPNNSIPN